MRTLIALFENLNEARATLDDLKRSGIAPEQVSVIAEAKDSGPVDNGSLHLRPMKLANGDRILGQGPLIPMLTPTTATASGDQIVTSLVRMGVPEAEATRYVEGVKSGFTLETVVVDDQKAQAALSIMQQHGLSNERADRDLRTGRGGAAETRVPIVEEQLRVGKQEVATGGVRVSTYVTTLPVEEEVTIRQEHVKVERRPANRPATAEAFRDQSIEVTAKSEEPVVAKEARVVEEVVLKKDVSHEKKTIKDRVRKTDVRVEPMGQADETAYRAHFDQTYGRDTDDRARYEKVLPAYKFGHGLRGDERFTGKDWTDVEADARTDWESEQPGTWDKFKEAIRHAWERAKG